MKKLWLGILFLIGTFGIYKLLTWERVSSEINIKQNHSYYTEKVYWIDCNTKIWKGINIVSEKWIGFELWPNVPQNQVDSIKKVADSLIKIWEVQGDKILKIHQQLK